MFLEAQIITYNTCYVVKGSNLKRLFTRSCVAFFSALLFSISVFADTGLVWGSTQRSTEWMYAGKVGLSSHYFAHTTGQVERLANQLKIDEIANQAATAGAAWFLFPLYHQPWIMMAPNEEFDRIIGHDEITSTRDVPLELSRALSKKGIRLMLYVNLRLDPQSKAPAQVREAMGGWPPNDKLVRNIAAVFREFSLRYGKSVSGWWVDGVQLQSEWGKSPHREEWFKEIADALRVGNPEALVAFNPGLRVVRYSQQNDYLAGESFDLRPAPAGRWIDGAQWHVWTYLGATWGSGGTRFTNEQLLDYGKQVANNGGVMTFDVGMNGVLKSGHPGSVVTVPENIGRIDPAQVAQIRFITQGLRELTH